jgi:Carboxypeptidase regulatory-like domain
MRCKNVALQLVAAFVCVAVLPSQLRGNEELVILPPQTVKSLNGVVVLNGVPIEGAIVAEFGADYKTEIRRTTTDAKGRFTLPSVRGQEIYHLQISAPGPGINPARAKVRISRRGKALLNIPLHVA